MPSPAVFALELLEQRVLLSAGDTDLSFGNSGQVTTEFSASTAWGTTVLATALQSDGRIVACGEGAVARYLSDGSLDVSFGGSIPIAVMRLRPLPFNPTVALSSQDQRGSATRSAVPIVTSL